MIHPGSPVTMTRMHITLSKKFRFEAAHWLPCFPEGHKCRRMHGHSFRFEVFIAGEVDPKKHLLMDYGEIKDTVQPLVEELDHRLLNEIEGLEVPTVECLAKWIYDRLSNDLPLLDKVIVFETATSSATYAG